MEGKIEDDAKETLRGQGGAPSGSGGDDDAPAAGNGEGRRGWGGGGQEGPPPAKVARSDREGGGQQGSQPPFKACVAGFPPPAPPSLLPCPQASVLRGMIPDNALVFGRRLGEGLCGVVSLGRCFLLLPAGVCGC